MTAVDQFMSPDLQTTRHCWREQWNWPSEVTLFIRALKLRREFLLTFQEKMKTCILPPVIRKNVESLKPFRIWRAQSYVQICFKMRENCASWGVAVYGTVIAWSRTTDLTSRLPYTNLTAALSHAEQVSFSDGCQTLHNATFHCILQALRTLPLDFKVKAFLVLPPHIAHCSVVCEFIIVSFAFQPVHKP